MTPCGPCSYGRTRHPASYGQLAHTAARVIRPLTAKLPMLQRASRPLWSSLIRPHASFGHPRPTCSYGRTRHSAIHGQLAHTAARVMTPCGHCSYGRTRHPASYGQLAHTAARVIRCATCLSHSQVARSPWRCTTAAYATRATWRLLHCSVSSAGGSYISVISILEGRERPADGPGARIRSKRIQASSGAERS